MNIILYSLYAITRAIDTVTIIRISVVKILAFLNHYNNFFHNPTLSFLESTGIKAHTS